MGRGRQKAKQQRIARKLKYLTTDTDYDKLAQELAHQDEEEPSAADPFASVEGNEHESSVADEASSEELDEYAQWAAEAAKKAEESKPVADKPVHKPFPMPKPGAFPKKTASSELGKQGEPGEPEGSDSAAGKTVDAKKVAGKAKSGDSTE